MIEALLGTNQSEQAAKADPTYQVMVERTVTHHVWIEVTAKNVGAASDLALARAGDIDFHGGSASEPEYSIGDIAYVDPDTAAPAPPKP